VYISVDMEGIAGVNHAKPTQRGDDAYPRSALLMTREANAAIEGAFDGGADEVVVNDSHGKMFNLLPEELDARARLVQGTKAWSMAEAAAEVPTTSRCSWGTTRAPAIREARSRTPTPARRR
jgi:D-amino peptidase